ncbi:hypothetical protein BCR33DRAFT_711810, partial [Rhizoclosmatium globosum]
MFGFMKRADPAPPMPDGEYCTATGCKPNELSARPNFQGFPVIGDDSIMSTKQHGTCATAPMQDLRFGVNYGTTDRICCFNRHYAEHSGYFLETNWLKEVSRTEPTTYYDPVSGKPLFRAPIGRSFDEFLQESKSHGWPSFRDTKLFGIMFVWLAMVKLLVLLELTWDTIFRIVRVTVIVSTWCPLRDVLQFMLSC